MSEVKGVNKTLIDADTRLGPGLFDGRVKTLSDTYEAAGLANPSTITMGGRLPKGAIVLAVLLSYDSLGGSTTLSVGDAEEAARYISGQDSSSASSTWGDLIDGINYTTDETDPDALDTQIVLTLGGAAATGTIKVTVFFTND